MQRSDVEVGHVHRYLCNTVFVDKPSNGFGAFQRSWLHDGIAFCVFKDFTCQGSSFTFWAPLLSYVKRNGIGATCAGCVEVEVNGYQEVACSHYGTTCSCYSLVKRTRTEIGLSLGISQLIGYCLVFASSAYGKVLSLW